MTKTTSLGLIIATNAHVPVTSMEDYSKGIIMTDSSL